MRWGPEHHVPQQSPTACVVACAGVVLRLRGLPFDEAELMRGASDRGADMGVAAAALGARLHRFLRFDELLARLSMGSLAIVKVSGPAYVKRVGVNPGGVRSSHGELAPPGDMGGPFHALLFVAQSGERLEFFDPWYPSEGQPFSMLREDLLAMYAAVVVEAAP